MKYRKGIFIVTYRKDKDKIKYLLLKRKLHWKGWEFPKGGFEKGTALQNLKREIKEEVGQQAKNIKNHKVKGQYKYKKKIEGRTALGQTYSLYSAEIKNEKVKVDKREHSAYKWLSFNQALKLLTWPNQKRCLKIVDKKLNGR